MVNTEIVKIHNQICSFVTSKNIYEAFVLLDSEIKNLGNDEILIRFEDCKHTYYNILSYSVNGVADPQKELILNDLILKILDLADQIKEIKLETINSDYREKKILNYSGLFSFRQQYEEIKHSVANFNNLKELLGEAAVQPQYLDLLEQQRKFNSNLFNFIVFRDKITDEERAFILEYYQNDILAWYDKALVISATSLSLIRYFDTHKLTLLFQFYGAENLQLKYRALVGIFISFLMYDERVSFYKNLQIKLKELYATSVISETDMMLLLKQWVRAGNTEKIAKKLNDEIIPDMQKLAPKIEEKLDLEKLLSDDDEASEKNPEWEKLFVDSPDLLNKIEELSKMQLEGNDVFMSTFSILKHFDFFKNTSNWFLPFYAENIELAAILANEDKEQMKNFAEALQDSTYMCDSDKYSFMLNLRMMPEQQRSMLLSMFSAEMEQMREVNTSDALINETLKVQTIFAQYVQNLYRFIKVFPKHNDWPDIFAMPLKYTKNLFVKTLFPENDLVLKISDFFFQNQQYDEALEGYLSLVDNNSGSMELQQKVGYALQLLGRFDEALVYYEKAELFDSKNIWNMKKMAFCYKKLGDFQKAKDIYVQILEKEPENKVIILNLANSFLNLKEYENALNLFRKLEFISGESISLSRPIAWCLFMLNQLGKAESGYQKIVDSTEVTAYDWITFGHFLLVSNRAKEAVNNYLNSCAMSKDNGLLLFKTIKSDTQLLISKGVAEEQIAELVKLLKFKLIFGI